MKNCKFCNQELKYHSTSKFKKQELYECSLCLNKDLFDEEDKFISKYYITIENDELYAEEVFIKINDIYYNIYINHIFNASEISIKQDTEYLLDFKTFKRDITLIEFSSAKQLINRIKTYLLFD